MRDTNVVMLVGRLTRDPEGKELAGGNFMMRFSLAFSRSTKKGDRWEDEANFIDCVGFGKMIKGAFRYMEKGKQIAITGELKQDRWETQDGQKRSKIVVLVNQIQLLGGKSDSSSREEYDAPRSEAPKKYREEDSGLFGGPEDFEDDIPF